MPDSRAAHSAVAHASTWLPLLQEALVKEGRFRWPLRGNSMWPTLPVECEIDLEPLTLPVGLGELIVFVVDDTLIAHRLVRAGGSSARSRSAGAARSGVGPRRGSVSG